MQADLLRYLAAAAIFPVLFWLLAEPGQGASHAAPRRIFFAALGALVFFALTERWVPEARPREQGRAFQQYTAGALDHRLSYSHVSQMAPEDAGAARGEPLSMRAYRQIEQAVSLAPESVFIRRHYGVVLAEQGRYEEARAEFEAAMDLLARRAPERAEAEREVWRLLFGETRARPGEIEESIRSLERYRLHWLGKVSAIAAYQRLEDDNRLAEVTLEARRYANRYFVRLIAGALIALLVPIFGLISLVVLAIFISTGVLRPAPLRLAPITAPLWESFILMLALGLSPGLFAFGLDRPAPESAPRLYAFLLLAGDIMILIAVAYLWWRLRTGGLRLSEIGLTTRNFWVDVGIGAIAASILIPFVVMVGLATQFVSDRLFPNLPPPYHPIGGLTVGVPDPLLRTAIFLAAVVGAPLLEEIFFRGALFGALRRRFGLAPGLLGSAVVFAILHPQLPLGFLPIAFLGMGFALLYEWRQTLVAPIVAHALNNGMVFVMLTLYFPSQ
jgi:uncharacterized protein